MLTINLVFHCWSACFGLLSKGMMCRGYISRGNIHHSERRQLGTGLNNVVDGEKAVTIFKGEAEKRGTPFIELNESVLRYVDDQGDKCVKDMFACMVRREDNLAAIFGDYISD